MQPTLLYLATIDMRRFTGFAALIVLASTAKAQDTAVVVVRHIAASQDTSVVVRHLAPQQQQLPRQRAAAPFRTSRYALSSTVLAKDPNVGSMLSLSFPGGGQYYAGATGKGLAITLVAIGAPIIGYANVNREQRYSNVCNAPGGGPQYYGGGYCAGRNGYNWAPAAIGLGVGITAWLYGVATAGTDVQRWNREHGVRFVTAPGRAGFAIVMP